MGSFSSQFNASKDAIIKSTMFQSALNWHAALTAKDKKMVDVIAVIFALAIAFNLLWHPSVTSKERAQLKFNTELSFHNKMKDNAYLFTSADASAVTTSILTTVNSTAKAKGVQLQRFEPEGKQGLRVWLDQVSFDKAIDWIELLEIEKHIVVEQITVDKVAPGIVNIRAVLRS